MFYSILTRLGLASKSAQFYFVHFATLSQKYSAFEIFVKRISQFTNFII